MLKTLISRNKLNNLGKPLLVSFPVSVEFAEDYLVHVVVEPPTRTALFEENLKVSQLETIILQ